MKIVPYKYAFHTCMINIPIYSQALKQYKDLNLWKSFDFL